MGIKEEVKKKAEDNFQKKDLAFFEFSETEFSTLDWKEEREFRLNGKMYDIVDIKYVSENKIQVYCFDDEKEASLFALNEKLIHNNSSDSTEGKSNQKLTKVIPNYFFQNIIRENFIPTKTVLLGLQGKTTFTSFAGEVPSPPPKLV